MESEPPKEWALAGPSAQEFWAFMSGFSRVRKIPMAATALSPELRTPPCSREVGDRRFGRGARLTEGRRLQAGS